MMETPARQKINWTEIAVFYIIAVGVSAPFRLRWINLEEIAPLPFGLNSFYAIFRGIGPVIGFFIVFYVLKSSVPRTLSFWGLNKLTSFLAMAVMPIGITIVSGLTTPGASGWYEGMTYGLALVCYALAEEYGWRGYLQEALAPLPMIAKVMVIAVLWYVWHLNFLRPGIPVQTHLIHFVMLVLGSWGLLKITGITKSILFGAAVHLSFNVASDMAGPIGPRLAIVGVAVIVWVVLIRRLPADPGGEAA